MNNRPNEKRHGIVADVHANLQALEAVLAWLDERGVTEIVCLGDVVGYGGDPERCLAIVRERCPITVRGNHDHAVIEPRLRRSFNEHARRAVERHAEMLSQEERGWLADLPARVSWGTIELGHASFVNPEAYPYVTGTMRAMEELEVLSGRTGFIGHTHVPAIFSVDPDGYVEGNVPVRSGDPAAERGRATELVVRLAPPHRYLVNPGSVGQPRDRDPRAAAGIFDPETGDWTLVRLPYDVPAAQRAIVDRGLPAFEASRLAFGM